MTDNLNARECCSGGSSLEGRNGGRASVTDKNPWVLRKLGDWGLVARRRLVRFIARRMITTGERLYAAVALPETKAFIADVERLRQESSRIVEHVYFQGNERYP